MPSDAQDKPNDPETVSRLTLQNYNGRAEVFWQGTRDHDVSQNIKALLDQLSGEAPLTILDFGCGPGRDLKALTQLGHCAIGLDGAVQFVEMARAFSGCEVWQQTFDALDLPPQHFDGIFANATLFHVPTAILPTVLKQFHNTLKPNGVLFSSNPHGDDREGWNGDRFAAYHTLESWRRYLLAAGFVELSHYYRPEGLPREQQPWLASVWRKVG